MSPKPALKREPSTVSASDNARFPSAAVAVPGPRRISVSPIRPVPNTTKTQPHKETSFQARVPVITGEATYRGSIPVDGIITGQLGANGSALAIKQRPRNGSPDPQPE